MTHIENILLCMASPLLIGILSVKGGKPRQSMSFLLTGMIVCFLSAYINSFLAGVYHANAVQTAVEISPVVEEVMKALPMVWFLLVFRPQDRDSRNLLIFTALGFATFENVCWMIENGSASILKLAVRGLATGTMHIVAASLVGLGMFYLWDQKWLYYAGTLGLLGAAITYHGMFNLLITANAPVSYIGYALPVVTALVMLFLRQKR